MGKIDLKDRYVFLSVLMFILVFALAFSGSVQSLKTAFEIKKERQTAQSATAVWEFAGVGSSGAPIKNNTTTPVWEFQGVNSDGSVTSTPGNNGFGSCANNPELCKYRVDRGDPAPVPLQAKITNTNWCSTTYASISQSGSIKYKDCRSQENPVTKALKSLYSCVIKNSALSEETLNFIRFYNLACFSPATKEQILADAGIESLKDDFKKAISKSDKQKIVDKHIKNKKLLIPTKCKKELDKFVQAKKSALSNVKKPANAADFKSCAFKGVAYCVLKPEYKNKVSSQACKTATGAISSECESDIVSSVPKDESVFSCSPKNKKNGSGGGSGAGSGSGSGAGTRPPALQRPPAPPTNTYGVPPVRSATTPNATNNKNRNYDPCKDPSYTQKQDMGFLSGMLFRFNCAFFNNSGKSNKNDKDSEYNNTRQITPSCVLSADKSSVNYGDTVTLKWRSGNAASAYLKNSSGNTLSTSVSGEISVSPTESGTYTLTVRSKSGQEATCSKFVNVSDNPVRLSCSPQNIAKDSSVQIEWSCPAGAELKDSNFNAQSASGSVTRTLGASKEFTLSCKRDDKEFKASCFVQVSNPALEIIAYPLQAGLGEKAKVTWAATNMQSCKVTGPRGFEYVRNFAVVSTTPFPRDQRINNDIASYKMECTDKWGKFHSKEVSIRLLGDFDYQAPKDSEQKPEEPARPQDEINTTIKTSLDPKQCPHFTRYYKVGDRADEVRKIKIFLKDQGIYHGVTDDYYSQELDAAVRTFQARYADEILKPWGLTAPTGYWYKTTRKKANYLAGCAEGAVVLDDGTVVY